MYYSFGILENSKKAKNINRNTYLSDFINTYLSNKYIVTTMTKKIEIRTEKFNVLESKDSDDNEVTIEGTAVPYNKRSRNGAKYTGKSIKKAAKTLEGKSLLYNHDENQVLGKVEKTIPREDRLDFIAKANTEKEKVQDIHNGYVNTVSIQAMVEENKDAEEKEVLDVQEFLELSATPVPGFGDASIKHNVDSDAEIRVETFDSLTENNEDTSSEPFSGFDDFEDCKQTMKDKGHSDEEADKICGALQDEYETNEDETNKNEGDNMTDENEEQEFEDLEDALNWIESNAPDEVISMIQDALQTEEADDDEDDEDNEEDEASEEGDKDKPEEKETEEEEEEEDTNEDNEDTEEKLQKLTERIEKLEKQESKEVEKSKQPNVGSEKPTDASTLAEKIRKAAKGGD